MHSPHPPATEVGGIKTLGEYIKPAHVGLYAPSPTLCGLLLAFPGLEFGLQTHLVITYVPLLEQGLISSDILDTFVADSKYDILYSLRNQLFPRFQQCHVTVRHVSGGHADCIPPGLTI